MKTFVLISFFALLVGQAYSLKPCLHKPALNTLSQPSIELAINNPSSKSTNDGLLKIRITGGQAPYTSQIIGTYAAAQTFHQDRFELNNIGIGHYTIIVQDNAKQIVQKSIEIIAKQ